MSEVVTQPASELVVGESEEALAHHHTVVRRSEHGMVSAEWAVGLIAAIAVAGVLLAVVTNAQVKATLLSFVLSVIHRMSGVK